MSSIILYLGLCLAGYIAAVPLRKYSSYMGWHGKTQNMIVLLLVFTMGLRVGANEEVIENLGTYGLYSLAFTFFVFLFSVFACSVARRMVGIDRYGNVVDRKAGGFSDADKKEKDGSKSFQLNPFTVLIAVSVGLGLLAGFMVLRLQILDSLVVESAAGTAISVELCTLLVLVGLDMGLAGEVVSNFKKAGLRVLIIPLSVMAGTLAGACVTGILLPLGIKESLAIGAGLGWYSLGAGILMDNGMVTAGAISFMHNIMREFFSLLLIPVIAEKIGYVEAVALPGSTAMDVCLPVVARSTNGNVAVYSFISGVLLSAAVPVIVPMFL